MSISRDEWLQRHQAACERRIHANIEKTEISARADGGFDVFIRGENLAITAMPGSIRVGGRPVRNITMRDRTLIQGIVDDAEEGEEVAVDVSPDERVTASVQRVS